MGESEENLWSRGPHVFPSELQAPDTDADVQMKAFQAKKYVWAADSF